MLVFNNLISSTVTQSMLVLNGLLYRMESQILLLLLLLLVLKAISPSVLVIELDDLVFND